MVTILKDLVQGSEEWFELRKGKITGTSAWKLLAGQSPEDIIKESEQESDFQGNKYTERGHVLENEARQIYSEINNVCIDEAGAILNDDYPNCLSSPDGLVGNISGIEIKSFLPEHMNDVWAHLDNHIVAQIQWNLFLSERMFWDLILFNPDLPPEQAYKCKRFYPDEEIFQKFRDALSNPIDDACIEETGLTLIKLEQELQAQDEQLKAQLEIRESLNNQILKLKEYLKQTTSGKVSKKIELGNDTLSLSIYNTHRVQVSDPSQIEDEYTLKEELPEAFVENGKIYRRTPNTKLVANLIKCGKPLPQGFEDKISRSISIKFNGEII